MFLKRFQIIINIFCADSKTLYSYVLQVLRPCYTVSNDDLRRQLIFMIVILFNEHLKKTNNENFNTPYQLYSNASLMAGFALRWKYNFEMKWWRKIFCTLLRTRGAMDYKFAKIKFTIYGYFKLMEQQWGILQLRHY